MTGRARSPRRGLRESLGIATRLGREWLSIGRPSRLGEADFSDVEAYCFFVGYPRSGHTLIGSLLDAHPNAVIALEAGAFRYVYARFDRGRLFHLLRENARSAGAAGRPSSSEFRYEVPGQWQGRHDRILIVGDNQAEGATLRLRANPALLQRLRATAGAPLRAIHVVRNPFDNITTIATRAAGRPSRMGVAPAGAPDLIDAIDRYRVLTRTVLDLKRVLGPALHEVRHEDFVAEPAARLGELCRWLGLEPAPDYLDASAEIVWPSPRATRARLAWPEEARRAVEALIADTPHLAGYAFDE